MDGLMNSARTAGRTMDAAGYGQQAITSTPPIIRLEQGVIAMQDAVSHVLKVANSLVGPWPEDDGEAAAKPSDNSLLGRVDEMAGGLVRLASRLEAAASAIERRV